MSKIAIENRIAKMRARGKENTKIIRKLERKLRKMV